MGGPGFYQSFAVSSGVSFLKERLSEAQIGGLVVLSGCIAVLEDYR